jgi:hypothetical protein
MKKKNIFLFKKAHGSTRPKLALGFLVYVSMDNNHTADED